MANRWNRKSFLQGAMVASAACLLLLCIAFGWLKRQSDAQRDAATRGEQVADAARVHAVEALVAALQDGARQAAARRTAEAPGLPAAFRANARLASFERDTILDASRLPLDQSFDVDWIGLGAGGGASAQAARKPAVMVTHGWYSGINTVEGDNAARVRACGINATTLEVRIAADDSWFSVRDPATDDVSLLPSPACDRGDSVLSHWAYLISKQKRAGARLSTLLPLPGPRLLAAWQDGRVELYRGAAEAAVIATFNAPVVAITSDRRAARFSLLSRAGELRLVDVDGTALAPPLHLQADSPTAIDAAAWIAFTRDAYGEAPRAFKFDADEQPLVLAVVPEPAGVSFYLHRVAAEAPRVFDVALDVALHDRCRYLLMLTAESLDSIALDTRCVGAGAERRQSVALPIPGLGTIERVGFASGVFCGGGGGGGNAMVLGSWHGDLLWARRVRSVRQAGLRVDIEHHERAWDDAATALACDADGAVRAGFRATGLKTFRSPMRLRESLTGIKGRADFAHVIEEDRVWPVATSRGPARLQLEVEGGDLSLIVEGRAAWRRKLIELSSDRTSRSIDKVVSVVVDAPRERVWVLTTLGRLALIELETGAVLARFSSSYDAVTPRNDVALEKPRLDAEGQFSFVHRVGDSAYQAKVEIESF